MAIEQEGRVTLMAVGDVGPIYEPVEPLVELAVPVLRQGDLRLAQCERVYSEEGANEKRVPVLTSVLFLQTTLKLFQVFYQISFAANSRQKG